MKNVITRTEFQELCWSWVCSKVAKQALQVGAVTLFCFATNQSRHSLLACKTPVASAIGRKWSSLETKLNVSHAKKTKWPPLSQTGKFNHRTTLLRHCKAHVIGQSLEPIGSNGKGRSILVLLINANKWSWALEERLRRGITILCNLQWVRAETNRPSK